MNHWISRSQLWVFAWALTACGGTAEREQQLREFETLHAAVRLVASATDDERVFRLDALDAAAARDGQNREYKQTCLKAYRAFDRARRSLEMSQVSMARAEQAVAAAKAEVSAGRELDDARRAGLAEASDAAAQAYAEFSRTLASAETLISSCEQVQSDLFLQWGAGGE